MHGAVIDESKASIKKLAMAFHLVLEGWEGQRILEMSKNQEMVIPMTEYIVRKGDIPSFFTAEHYAQLEMFYEYKEFGLPFAPKGYAYHPIVYIDIIKMLNGELAKRMKKPDANE